MKQKLTFLITCIVFSLFIPYVLTIWINGKNEADVSEVDKIGKTVTITDNGTDSKLDVEEFIPCVLMSQLKIDSEEEALKAQAVIIRTYILKQMGDQKEIKASDLDLPYLTYSGMQKSWGDNFAGNYNKLIKIVEKTGNEIIKYNDQMIIPYYHEASVGTTRNGNEVFGNEDYPYLVSVDSKEDVEADNYLSIKYFSTDDFINKLKAYNDAINLDPNTLPDTISITKQDSAGYALEVKVGDVTMTGDEFVNCLGINSACFSIENYEGEIRVITKGIGHGMGLSMYGAENLAGEGKSYKDILSYYYKNIVIDNE
jgi:stage II sporulation protein D